MDQEDMLMHTEDQPKVNDGEVSQVLKHLIDTANLSEFLDRLTNDARQMDLIVPAAQPMESDDRAQNSELEALQSDEEQITDGIAQLLESIKSGKPPVEADRPVSPKGSLEERAEGETDRLNQLTEQLQSELKNSHAPPALASGDAPKPKPVLKVPLPQLRKHLNGLISAELDRTVQKFEMMHARGGVIDPKSQQQIDHYMNLISQRLLHTCVSYEQWGQQHAVDDEAKAANDGDPEMLSRMHRGAGLDSSKVVQAFLARKWSGGKPATVPWSLTQMMSKGVELPGVGAVKVSLH